MLVSSWKPQSNPPRAMSGNRGSLIPGFEATFPLDLSMVDQHGALQIRLKLLHSERSEGRTAQKAKTAGIHRSDFEHDWKLLNHIFLLAVKACRAIRHTFCRKNWNIRLIRLRCLSGW